MSIVSKNLKYLRRLSGLTQEQTAEKVGIKRSLLGAYEEGRADPRLNNLMKFSSIYDVSVDRLISEDLTDQYSGAKKEYGRSRETGGVKVLSITVDNSEKENIELVPQKASAGYLNGYADPEFIEELPRFQLPFLPKNSTYRAFEISGDSMLPLQPGTVVIGKYVESLGDVRDGQTYVLVLHKEGVVYKRVYLKNVGEKSILLVSDNATYEPYKVDVEDVIEIWEAKAYISQSFPQTEQQDSLSLEKIASMVKDLQVEVQRLKQQ